MVVVQIKHLQTFNLPKVMETQEKHKNQINAEGNAYNTICK